MEGLTGGLVRKTTEDHAASILWLNRLQDGADVHDEDIKTIKVQLKMA